MPKNIFTAIVICGLICAAGPGLCASGAVAVMAPSQDINHTAAPKQANERTGGQTDGQTGGPRIIRLSAADEYWGALDIRIHPEYGKLMPSADFLLIDPTGKKAGAVSGKTFSEFAAGFADYEGLEDDETGEPGPSSGVIDISNPAEGGYVLRITGTEDGRYSIELNGYNRLPDNSHAEVLDAPIKKGEVKEYRFSYSSNGIPAMELTAK